MLKSTPSMGRSLDKQSDNQEILKPGSAFPLEKDTRTHSNSQMSTDNETEVIKSPLAEKAEQVRSERNGVKSKAPWKPSVEGEANGIVINEPNGTTIHAHSDSPDSKTLEKSDSPVSTPNDSSEISSVPESPSATHDDPKQKTSAIPAAGITSEDEASSRMDTTENSRTCKKRRWDDRGQPGNDDDSNMPVIRRLEEHDENDKPRSEIQKDLKEIENGFAQLKNQMHRERIQELDKEIASIKQGIHPDQRSRMDEIDKKRLRRLDITASRKKYQELHCQKQYDEAKSRTHYQCLADIRTLRKQILEDLENQKYRLIKEKNKLDDARLEHMTLEQTYLKQVQEQWLSTLSEFKYLQENHGFPAAPILETMKADEIEEDLELMGIVKEEEFQAPSSSSSSPQMSTIPRPNICDSNNNPFLSQEDHDVHSSGDRLYFGQRFKKGDALVIDSTSGRYTAKLLAVTDSEVVIQRPDGSKSKLQMNLLKEGKYQIHLKDS